MFKLDIDNNSKKDSIELDYRMLLDAIKQGKAQGQSSERFEKISALLNVKDNKSYQSHKNSLNEANDASNVKSNKKSYMSLDPETPRIMFNIDIKNFKKDSIELD